LRNHTHTLTRTPMMKCLVTLIIGVFFFLPTSLAQEYSEIDSLQLLVTQSKADTNRVLLLCDLAWEQKFDFPDEARTNLNDALAFAKSINYPKGQGQALNFLGVVETIHEDYEKAISYYKGALKIRESLDDQYGVASIYNNIGNLYEELGDFPLAVENLRNSLDIRTVLKDTLRMARASSNLAVTFENYGDYTEALKYALDYLAFAERLNEEEEIANALNSIGNIKTELERFDEALESYKKSLVIREQLGDEDALASIYNNMGNILDDLGERSYKAENFEAALPHFEQALGYHQKALSIRTKMDDESGVADIYNNLGVLYKNWGSYHLDLEEKETAQIQFDTAMSYLNQALRIRTVNEDKIGLIEVYNGIGDVRRREERLREALEYTERYLALAKEIDDQKFEQMAYKDLSRVYADLDDYKKAYKYRKKYDELRYERLDEKRIKDNERIDAVYASKDEKFKNEQLEKDLVIEQKEKQRANFFRNVTFFGLLFIAVIAGLVFNQNRLKTKSNRDLATKNEIIEEERKRSDELLLNILPAQTANELKEFGKAKAKRHDSVTVLFADIKSFTKISELLSPEDLVSELDNYFRQFDAITEKYGVEKIKTIGDAYMCAGGLTDALIGTGSSNNTNHANAVISAAKEILTFVNKQNLERKVNNEPYFDLRIGVHTGPVVSGVVGSHKFAYDIWGDTVNVAARMEQNSEAGRINISNTTFVKIKDLFNCTHRGKIDAKNKGAIDMYFVEAPITEMKQEQIL